ncbi:hypothetical protein ABVT39_003103 [Epinephelus coioides]
MPRTGIFSYICACSMRKKSWVVGVVMVMARGENNRTGFEPSPTDSGVNGISWKERPDAYRRITAPRRSSVALNKSVSAKTGSDFRVTALNNTFKHMETAAIATQDSFTNCCSVCVGTDRGFSMKGLYIFTLCGAAAMNNTHYQFPYCLSLMQERPLSFTELLPLLLTLMHI